MRIRGLLKLGLAVVLVAVAIELVLQVAALFAPDRGGRWREGARHRVLALGDSHTWGSGVEREDAYPQQLQRALDERAPGAYSVINRGLPGMSTTQLRNRLAVLLSRYRPDTVVLWCGANNLWNHAERDQATTPFRLRLDGWLSRLRSYRLVRVWLHDRPLERIARARERGEAWDVELEKASRREQRFTVSHDGIVEPITHERGENDPASLFDRTLADLEAIAATTRAAGVDLVLVTYPLDESFFAEANRAIREAAARHGLPVVESHEALARIPKAEQRWAWALHPDARLYREIVADLAPVLLPAQVDRNDAPADCTEAIAPITEGFGAPGPFAMRREKLTNPLWPQQPVHLHLPEGAEGPVPLVVLAHANGNPDPAVYAGLVRHVVSRGYALVVPSHQVESPRHRDRYEALFAGVRAAVDARAGRLDPGRIGFVGHSYGAGALPYLAHRALVEEGWGGDGAFLFSMAPWYALGLEGRDLRDLAGLEALFLVFEEDDVTDHRIAIAQHEQLAAGVASDYLLLHSDRNGGCALVASHAVPQSSGLGGRDDALDERAVYRLLDALAAHAFDGDPEARRVALGRGAPEQVSMGSWRDGTALRPLTWSASPEPARPESDYLFRHDAEDAWRGYGEPQRLDAERGASSRGS